MKAQVSDLGLARWFGLLPGSGGLRPSVLPTFYRRANGRQNAGDDELFEDARGVGLHAGQDVLVGLDGERR
ncbi:MAG: hypothetical protein M3179_13165, partial [Actinomycetota bacterium]|nr:hypothetical protein [Actinomycetota bacterium]